MAIFGSQDSELRLKRLRSGGLIVNYRCPSQCAHCLYACSPARSGGYMTARRATESYRLIRSLGCRSVHIGGGEPFLRPDRLVKVIEAAGPAGLSVEYVETNSCWFRNPDQAVKILKKLKASGLDRLLVSISPFHNSAVPFDRVTGVLDACRVVGLGVIPWTADFIGEVESFDPSRTHSLEEYRAAFGPDYLRRIPGRYWTHLGGRAVRTFARVFPLEPLDRILARSGPCTELTEVSHFHIDFHGRYIPGLCSGLGFRAELLSGPVPRAEHSVLTRLFNRGAAGLLDWAAREQAFRPAEQYLNKCHLCLDIRLWLHGRGYSGLDLHPAGFYEQLSRE